ncbi:MAG TPA: hypothetical protein VGS79_18520 [Puia sp.]|nr:hypothetical protein [Puia sp.]
MPETPQYVGLGLLIYNAVQKLDMENHDAAAQYLNVAPSTLFNYYKAPPGDIEKLISLSEKLGINLLAFYADREPLKGLLEAKDEKIKQLEAQINSLNKEKENLYYTIELQKNALAAQKNQGHE